MFQDDSIIIQFKFDDAADTVSTANIFESPVTLDWGKASIGISERYFGIPHASNFYWVRSGQVLFSCLHSDIYEMSSFLVIT